MEKVELPAVLEHGGINGHKILTANCNAKIQVDYSINTRTGSLKFREDSVNSSLLINAVGKGRVAVRTRALPKPQVLNLLVSSRRRPEWPRRARLRLRHCTGRGSRGQSPPAWATWKHRRPAWPSGWLRYQ